ncbi:MULTISPECIES: TetR/AcrR family transcriptional regulator [unclassified Streptomyces]|uniref:TetR/AcrR family transcriptional regulator n=1 Tax=unclassified Streptomyces TaxID=2593676 RepID=UPI00036B44AE|nr:MULTISPECIES: TetR/AcrR family transcriptional regulator [unclassified Streptomyces]MYT31192.1 TetR family transcriptional regulator [Streptomyces sp. SID8354]
MAEGRRERADAVRNRRAILAATEELLAHHPPEKISMEQVAAAAGVGKGTVFHRFGSRMGLMLALMEERAVALREAVTDGPPPLGPGAASRERLLAFLDAIVALVARNKGLLAALCHASTTTAQRPADDEPGGEHPFHAFWHGHVSALLAAQRPDLDAGLLAHFLIGALQNERVLRLLERGETDHVAGTLRALVTGLLDAAPPAAGAAPGTP